MRVKLEKPDNFIFETELSVRINDLNYGNHLSNEKLLVYAHQARVELFEHWGLKELEIDPENNQNLGIIMADAAIMYQSEGHLNDKIKIEVAVQNISRVGFDLYYQMHNLSSNQDLALLKTGIICFDYARKKVVSIPQNLKKQLGV